MRHAPLLALLVACGDAAPTTTAGDLTEGTLDVERLPPQVVLEDELPAPGVSRAQLDAAVEGLAGRLDGLDDALDDLAGDLSQVDATASAARTAGVQITDFASALTLADGTWVELLSLTVPGSPAGALSLVTHVYLEKAADPGGRYELTLRDTDCDGANVGRTLWRPAVGTGSLHADAVTFTGFATGVTGSSTFVLCGRKFDAGAPDATAYARGIVAHW